MEQRMTHNLVAIAHAIMQQPDAEFYGAEILKELDFTTGVGYPLLNRMAEEYGQLESKWDTSGRKPVRLYSVTDKGREDFARLLERAKHERRFAHLFAGETA